MTTQIISKYPTRVKSRLKDTKPKGVPLHASDRNRNCPKCSKFIGRGL